MSWVGQAKICQHLDICNETAGKEIKHSKWTKKKSQIIHNTNGKTDGGLCNNNNVDQLEWHLQNNERS